MPLQTYILISLFFLIFSRSLNETQLNEIDRVIKERMKSAHLNKFGLVIVNSSSIIHQKVFGEGIDITSRFPIASVTKSFTALAILKLNISLNETIDHFNLGDSIDKELAKNITVGELMSHSSGLDGASPKIVAPKGFFVYSNYGYGLLGKIIADKSQEKDYGKFIKNHIFDELNMTNSGTDYDNNFMDSYNYFLGGLSKYGSLEADYKYKDGFNIPAGYIRSTIEDIGKYIKSYLNDKNNKYVKEMGIPKTKIAYNIDYGMGLFIRNKNGKSIYDHSGIIDSFLTHLYIYPNDDLAYFFFTNTRDHLCQGPFYRFQGFLENLIVNDVNIYEDNFASALFDNMDFFFVHFAVDIIVFIVILIPFTYLVITVIRKIKKKKPTWFDGIKGLIIFIVDILLLIILPIILLITLFNTLKETKDFLFPLLTATIIMMITFVLKFVYFFIYKKYWKDSEDIDDIINKKTDKFELDNVDS